MNILHKSQDNCFDSGGHVSQINRKIHAISTLCKGYSFCSYERKKKKNYQMFTKFQFLHNFENAKTEMFVKVIWKYNAQI